MASKNTEREAREARDRLRRYNARHTVHAHQVSRRRRDNVLSVVALVVVAALATGAQLFYFSSGPGKTPAASASPSSSASPSATAGANKGNVPSLSLAQNREWTGTLELNAVKLGITLDGKAAPQAVAVFVQEVKDNYFPGKTCHRLVSSSSAGLIQCGSLSGTGAGDPNFSFGPVENAPSNSIYPAGTIAMARAGGNAYSQDHQFFIVFKDAQLPADAAGGYTVFGHVTSGLSQLESKITNAGVAPGGTSAQDGSPVTKTTITSVTIK